MNKNRHTEALTRATELLGRPVTDPAEAYRVLEIPTPSGGTIGDREWIVELALLAFWNSIAKSYPETTTGDFPPLAEHEFAEAAKRAVSVWIDYNVAPEGPGPVYREAGCIERPSPMAVAFSGRCWRGAGHDSSCPEAHDFAGVSG